MYKQKTAKLFILFVAMSVAIMAILVQQGSAIAQGGTTEIVSVASDGTRANGPSRFPSISADGRFVAFVSEASNLVDDDTNGVADCFVHDRLTGETTRVSVASDGTEGNGAAAMDFTCIVSGNGRYIAFASSATNLVEEATYGNWPDAFLHDQETGATTLISQAYNGTPGDWPSTPGAISYDGRHIVFWSPASNILPGNPQKLAHLYAYDRVDESTTRVSVASDGTPGNDGSYGMCISADGNFIAYGSHATNLVSDDTNGLYDIFKYELMTGSTGRISVAPDGAEANGSSGINGSCMSETGRYVVFASEATNFVMGDTNGYRDDFVYDSESGTITRVSVASDGSQANGGRRLFAPSISLDGRYIEMESWASNLVPKDTNNRTDVFIRDRELSETTRASVTSWGLQGNRDSNFGVISGNGRFVALESEAKNLVFKDRNRVSDIFVYDQMGQTNIIQNPGFETGTQPWKFYTNGIGTFTTDSPGYEGDYAARIDITEPGSNVQLYQNGFPLEPKTYYRLAFAARSGSGHDVAAYIHQHKSPYANHGLRNFRINLTEEWDEFTIEFRTKNITKPTDDSRLRLWLKPFDEAGDTYWFDSISLTKRGAGITASSRATDTGEITGLVMSIDDQDKPIMVTLVDMETEGLSYRAMAQVDEGGRYHFGDVPYGTYEVRVNAPNGYLTPESVQLGIGEKPNEPIDFVLEVPTDKIHIPFYSQ